MAFQKLHELPSGVSGDHWQIIQTTVDVQKAYASCMVALYKNSDAASQNKQVLVQCPVNIIGVSFAQFIADISFDYSEQPPLPPAKDAITAMYEIIGADSSKPWYGGIPVQDQYWWAQ